MWLGMLSGFVIGILLNLAADWYSASLWVQQDWMPREAGAGRAADAPSPQPSSEKGRRIRWVTLLLASVSLSLHLLSCWHSALIWSALAQAMPDIIYCSLLLLIAAIDLEHRLIPDRLILVGLLLSAGLNLLGHSLGLTMSLAGAVTGGGLFLLVALARPNALGAGDIKLAFLIGMLTGFPWVLQALVLGVLLGGLSAALLLLFRVRGPKQYIPYAPYLVAGCIATLLYGQQIMHWYAGLSGAGG